MCDRADVPQSAKLKAFPTMLKGLALDYYYSNMSTDTLITFDEVCFSMRNYFEDAEYRRSILSKWNNLTLKSIMTKSGNEGKSIEECLQLLIKNLRHLQHDLNPELRSEKFIHNKLINACQDVSACQYACFKLSDSLADLINDLRSSIVTYQKANSANFSETLETFFTDRRYHKNFPPRIRNFSSRINQNRRYPYSSRKKCFVCQKEGCWSTKHSKDERETARQKFKNRFFNQVNKRIDQYISEYEGTDLSSSYSEDDSDTDLIDEMKALIVNLSPFPALPPIPDNPSNVETFITSFDPVENANAEIMTTNLANRSLSHFLTNNLQTSLKTPYLPEPHPPDPVHTCMKDVDPFTYITTDRYTSEVFYGIMIDSRASVRSTADYEQYLAFTKNTPIELDPTKAGAVNVQFDIGSTPSIGSLTIDTPFELVEFHVIKADTPFLLSLADMNRLKVYFNNVENTLFMTTKNRSLPVIRRFGHGFLL